MKEIYKSLTQFSKRCGEVIKANLISPYFFIISLGLIHGASLGGFISSLSLFGKFAITGDVEVYIAIFAMPTLAILYIVSASLRRYYIDHYKKRFKKYQKLIDEAFEDMEQVERQKMIMEWHPNTYHQVLSDLKWKHTKKTFSNQLHDALSKHLAHHSFSNHVTKYSTGSLSLLFAIVCHTSSIFNFFSISSILARERGSNVLPPLAFTFAFGYGVYSSLFTFYELKEDWGKVDHKYFALLQSADKIFMRFVREFNLPHHFLLLTNDWVRKQAKKGAASKQREPWLNFSLGPLKNFVNHPFHRILNFSLLNSSALGSLILSLRCLGKFAITGDVEVYISIFSLPTLVFLMTFSESLSCYYLNRCTKDLTQAKMHIDTALKNLDHLAMQAYFMQLHPENYHEVVDALKLPLVQSPFSFELENALTKQLAGKSCIEDLVKYSTGTFAFLFSLMRNFSAILSFFTLSTVLTHQEDSDLLPVLAFTFAGIYSLIATLGTCLEVTQSWQKVAEKREELDQSANKLYKRFAKNEIRLPPNYSLFVEKQKIQQKNINSKQKLEEKELRKIVVAP